ncbi:prostaglandin E2 receptor EP2 subtype isoform X1 [Vespula maculifrons]|uniref:Prostaglandin E2 receptor EP2 subtype isoform X1 n=1 Tax=Vespula maculifrons TaxID=7453 RepID=A0ABD2B4C4_VESMC
MKMIEKITSSFHTEALQNDSLSIVDLASTMMTMNVTVPNIPKRHVTLISQAVLTLVYITGVIGNVSALVILFHRDKRRNRKHLLMLRCLASNDLVALLGMLVQMYISIYVAGVTSNRAFCSLRVVWRLFGLFSGCVAIVMAAERWLALTRPFVYQKQVTYPVIVRCMLALWLAALSLTSLPVLGFGLYYKDDHCVRYREATELTDIAYAYVWFVFGTLLCLSIVWCNLAVSRALGTLGRRAGALRRISRASSRAKPLLTVTGPTPEVVATAEERAFARLMAVLSISFVVCWMPQMRGRKIVGPSRSVEKFVINSFVDKKSFMMVSCQELPRGFVNSFVRVSFEYDVSSEENDRTVFSKATLRYARVHLVPLIQIEISWMTIITFNYTTSVQCWMTIITFVKARISIPLAQFSMTLTTKMVTLKRCIHAFHIVADILLCVHFTLDPYIYVLLRMPRPRFRLLKPLCKICWPARSRSNSFTGTGDNHCSSGDPPTPITEAPSTPVSEEHESELATVNV